MSTPRPVNAPPSLPPLDDCPVKDGFRMRGMDMTRMETFTDAAFAFAVTLLVVSIDRIPTSVNDLLLAVRDMPAFICSFAILMIFWHGHWKWSRHYGLEDGMTVLLSTTLVLVVLCYVYPLRYMTSLFFKNFSGGTLSSGSRVSSAQELYDVFAIYSVGFSLMASIILLLHVWTLRRRAAIALNDLESYDTRCEIGAWIILTSVGVLSILLALFTAPSRFAWPGSIYMVLAFVMPAFAIICGRRRRRYVDLT